MCGSNVLDKLMCGSELMSESNSWTGSNIQLEDTRTGSELSRNSVGTSCGVENNRKREKKALYPPLCFEKQGKTKKRRMKRLSLPLFLCFGVRIQSRPSSGAVLISLMISTRLPDTSGVGVARPQVLLEVTHR